MIIMHYYVGTITDENYVSAAINRVRSSHYTRVQYYNVSTTYQNSVITV
jgi:hypothetical protein